MCNEDDVKHLIDDLRHSDSSVRYKAAKKFSDYPNQKATDALIQALQDNDPMVSYTAAVALSKIDSSETTQKLLKLLEDLAYNQVRNFKDNDYNLGSDIAIALGLRKDYSVFLSLLKLISGKSDLVRTSAILALGYYKDERLLKTFVELTKEASVRIQRAAVGAICYYDKKDTVVSLLQILDSNNDDFVKKTIIKKLADFDDYTVLPILEHYALYGVNSSRYDSYPVRQVAEKAIKRIKERQTNDFNKTFSNRVIDSDFYEHIKRQIRHSDWQVRLSAVDNIKYVKNAETVALLLDALDEKNQVVTNAIVQVLISFGEAEIPTYIENLKISTNEQQIYNIVRVFAFLRNVRTVEPLISLLKITKGELQSLIVDTLGYIGDDRAIQTLIDIVLDKNTNELLLSHTIVAISMFNRPISLYALSQILSNYNVGYSVHLKALDGVNLLKDASLNSLIKNLQKLYNNDPVFFEKSNFIINNLT